MANTLLFKVISVLLVFILLFNILGLLFSNNSQRLTFSYCVEKFSQYNSNNLVDFAIVFDGLDTALEKMTIDATGNKIVDGLISFVNAFTNMLVGSATFICYGGILLYSLCSFGLWLWTNFV